MKGQRRSTASLSRQPPASSSAAATSYIQRLTLWRRNTGTMPWVFTSSTSSQIHHKVTTHASPSLRFWEERCLHDLDPWRFRVLLVDAICTIASRFYAQPLFSISTILQSQFISIMRLRRLCKAILLRSQLSFCSATSLHPSTAVTRGRPLPAYDRRV